MEETNELLRQILDKMTEREKITLTMKEAAEKLGVSMPVMSNLTFMKGFPAFRLGRRVLIDARGLEEWVREQAKGGAA